MNRGCGKGQSGGDDDTMVWGREETLHIRKVDGSPQRSARVGGGWQVIMYQEEVEEEEETMDWYNYDLNDVISAAQSTAQHSTGRCAGWGPSGAVTGGMQAADSGQAQTGNSSRPRYFKVPPELRPCTSINQHRFCHFPNVHSSLNTIARSTGMKEIRRTVRLWPLESN